MSEVRCESVSHASRTELCYMRRYSALPQVYVRAYACVCERCGLFDDDDDDYIIIFILKVFSGFSRNHKQLLVILSC